MLLYKQQFIAEKLPTMIGTLKEHYAAEKETSVNNKQFNDVVKETLAGERSNPFDALSSMMSSPYNAPFKNSLTALNTLFPDQIPEEDYRGMHSVQDMLAYAQSHTPAACRGRTPSSSPWEQHRIPSASPQYSRPSTIFPSTLNRWATR